MMALMVTKLNVITDEQAAEIKAKNSGTPARLLRYEVADFVIRPAPGPAYQRFLDEIADKDQRSNAGRALVFACVLHPAEKELISILDQRPGLVSVLADECATFSGARAATEKKDL